jgi:D-beta-D-heptose 7-phosphate kinase / D-beta-D-heptose 1-phosphate adenosyltransferase
MLDRYIWGTVDRISPEAPVPVVAVTKTEDRLGGAGNVVRNLTALGARVSACGFVGDDKEGQTVLQLLSASGVNKEGVLIDKDRPTTVKTRVIAHAQQVVRIDREVKGSHSIALREGFSALVDAQIDSSRAVVLSDYGKGAISETLMRHCDAAHAAKRIGWQIRPLVLDPHPSNYSIYHSVTVAKPNRKEAELASGIAISDRASAAHAGRVLIERWGAEVLLITLGEDGMAVVKRGTEDALFLETVAREVFDVSGAGDTVTAIFAAAAAVGASERMASSLANIAAGIVVSEVGTVAVDMERLKAEVKLLAA